MLLIPKPVWSAYIRPDKTAYLLAKAIRYVVERVIPEPLSKGKNVWFLGRDCDLIYQAIRQKYGLPVRYLFGVNRRTGDSWSHYNRHCPKAKQFRNWLKSFGVRDGDLVIDTGFRGSLIDTIKQAGIKVEGFLLCSRFDHYPGYSNNVVFETAIIALESLPRTEYVAAHNKCNLPRKRGKASDNSWFLRLILRHLN